MTAWRSGGDLNLQMVKNDDREWNGDAAEDRIFRWAGGDKFDPRLARRAFFAYDADNPHLKTSYKLPFADVIDGELRAVPHAIYAVAAVLEGARGGVDVPRHVQQEARKKVAEYYRKMGEK